MTSVMVGLAKPRPHPTKHPDSKTEPIERVGPNNGSDRLELGLAGDVAVVTGAASGIGRATALALRAEGCRVACWDRAFSEPSSDPDLLQLICDITQPDSLAAALTQTEAQLGPIVHVVHAAATGSGHFGFPFTHVPPEAWRNVLDVNILGTTNVAHAVAPGLMERRRGTIVIVASIAGQIGSPTDPPYSASKAANINFAQCLAKDLAPYDVRVNTVCPGMVQTPLNRRVWESWAARQSPDAVVPYETWAAEKIARMVPLNRWQTAADVADMIVFLSSARAAQVTGQTINVDGGMVMHW
jgi:2-hydroxycyclohexanecarboxyl-CoA dehydrogenase